ncbi:hypothetical protein [Prosthecomicrobium sp. N25]|uniref:hypothetical protein n=1 Tax=Prosthecomicrobium sp. N25 TaxID=3129254 RepID=UPI0030789BA9
MKAARAARMVLAGAVAGAAIAAASLALLSGPRPPDSETAGGPAARAEAAPAADESRPAVAATASGLTGAAPPRRPDGTSGAGPSEPGAAALPGGPAPGSAPPRPAPAGEVRVVTPPGVTPPPAVTGPLERLPAREVPKPPAQPPKVRVLRPVMAETPGIIRAGEIRIRLPDIEPLGVDAQCRGRDGREWPCGAQALAALRAFAGGRGVQCFLPADAQEGNFAIPCRLGKTDVATWLVRQGWAKPAADRRDLAEAEAAARKEKRGMWQETPATTLAEPAPVE